MCVAQLKWQFESNRCNFTPHYAVEVTVCNVVLIQNELHNTTACLLVEVTTPSTDSFTLFIPV